MTKELKQEYTLRITQANKTQLITILYEMLLSYVEDAAQAADRAQFREAIRRSRGCVNELLASLNFEYELAFRFLELYLYVNRELIKADIRNTTEPLAHIEKVIGSLHDAYEQIEAKDTSASVMRNAQTVYAGLTYGKSQLNENLADHGMERGFRV